MLDMSLRDGFFIQEKQLFNRNRQNISYCKKKIGDILVYFGMDIREKRIARNFSQLKKKLEEQVNKRRPHAIVFAGGQMFNETFISRIEMIVSYAENEGIPVYFNACGCGVHLSKRLKNRITNILNSNDVRYISVRDGYFLIQSLTKKNVINTLDTALLVSNYYNGTHKKDIIGIGIMVSKHHSIAKQIRFWRQILTLFDSNDCNFQLFCNGDPNDYAFAKYLLVNTGLYKEERIAECPVTPEDLIMTISKYNSIISMRLHSLIVAYSYGVPAIAISWDRKVWEFYHKMGNDKYCFTMNDNVDDVFTRLMELKCNSDFFYEKSRSNKIVQDNMNRLIELLRNDKCEEKLDGKREQIS
jgi:polysaccharide pyruvyl transferase WcaK-like protein